MTKTTEEEVNLTATDGITPIFVGTTDALPSQATEDPEREALPSTPEPAMEDTIMAGPAQSTPEAGNREEPFPASTPDLNPDLMDKSEGDFDLDYNATSSEDNMGGGVEESSVPQQDSVVEVGSNTPEGTMTPPSPADTTPQENLNNQRTIVRQLPSQINPPGQTEAPNTHQTKNGNPSQSETPFNPSGLSTLQGGKQKQVYGRMLDVQKFRRVVNQPGSCHDGCLQSAGKQRPWQNHGSKSNTLQLSKTTKRN